MYVFSHKRELSLCPLDTYVMVSGCVSQDFPPIYLIVY